MMLPKLIRTSGPLLLMLALLVLPTACTQQNTSQDAEDVTAPVSDPSPDNDTAVVSLLPPRAHEARPSPNAGVAQTIGTTEVEITYGRPGVKGRQVFGELEPCGAVWRAGANEATVISFSGDVTVNGEPVPAGVYAFFAIPGEEEWTLIFNEEAGQWGAFGYNPDKDVLRVAVTPEAGAHEEWLTYYFEALADTSATAVLHWDTVKVPFTIAAN
ncbi:MAG: DUF2911 domain-containing protein [Rhodothermales bacterium]